MERVLIAGCGYVGGRLAELLVEDGVEVWGMRRGGAGLPPGVHALEADVTDPATLGRVPPGLDAVVYAVSPDDRSEAAYRAAYVDGPRNVVRAAADAGGFGGRTILVGSTGVYGFTDGRWVDEDTPPEPADPTGERLLEGEEVVRSLASPGVALRLGGIYGPGRTSTLRRVVEGRARCPGPDRFGNRIHRDDAAGALRHLLGLPDPHHLYLGVDREPARLRDVYRWIAGRAGAPDPCGHDGDETWEARGRRGTSKRCSSDRLVASGYRFHYPTFREGYGALLSER